MIGIFLASGIRAVAVHVDVPVDVLDVCRRDDGRATSVAAARRRRLTPSGANTREMISRLRATVHERAERQYDFLAHSAPNPAVLASLVGSTRQWELSNPERDRTNFWPPGLAERSEARWRLTMAPDRSRGRSGACAKRGRATVFGRNRAVHDMPVKIDLKTHPAVRFFGEAI